MRVFISKPGKSFVDERREIEITELDAPVFGDEIGDEVRIFSSPGGNGLIIHVPDQAGIMINRGGKNINGINIIEIKKE